MLAVPLLAVLLAAPPNVVLIVADDLGYADLGCNGATDIATPHLDRLARDGTRFTEFAVAQAVCTASRAALLTGCYPNRIGMARALNHTSRTGVHPRATAERGVEAPGVRHRACFGKWHLGHRPPFLPTRSGFDAFFGIPYSHDNGLAHPVTRGLPPLPLVEGERVVETDPDPAHFTRRFTERAVQFIAENKGRPFFLYLPHPMPHVPVAASDRFRGTSKRGLYGDAVQEFDWGVGKVLAALTAHGPDATTLVLFLSDNGPFLSYGDHAGSAGRLREGKLTTFEGGTRVPCLARWPGRVPAGRTCDSFWTALDLHATLLHLCGSPPARTDGENLAPLLLGGSVGRERFRFYSGDELHAVRDGRWKLHVPHDYLAVAGEPGRGGKPSMYGKLAPAAMEESGVRGIASRHGYRVARTGRALYDVSVDPGETTDVAANAAIVTRLEALAEAARAELGDTLTGRAGSGRRAVGVD